MRLVCKKEEESEIVYTSRIFESKCTFNSIISTRIIYLKIHEKILKTKITNVFNSSEFSKPGRKILLKSKFG
jgi:hypothetical protein